MKNDPGGPGASTLYKSNGLIGILEVVLRKSVISGGFHIFDETLSFLPTLRKCNGKLGILKALKC